MSASPAAKAPSPPPPTADPYDLLAEGARARKLSGELEGVKCMAEGMRLINNTVMAHVLLALWESGFYEYSLTHPNFTAAEAAEALNLDAGVLLTLLHHLIGYGILSAADGRMQLTDYGSRFSNVVLRGVLNINLGGYGAQLQQIGPLLRKEITKEEIDRFHSTDHSGLGTEQLTSVRLVPAVLKMLVERNLHRVLHLACGSGGFLVQMARSDPAFTAIGIDKQAKKIAGAEQKVSRYGLESRIRLLQSEIGVDPLPLDEQERGEIDVVASIYLLHEIGRYGRQRIVDLLRQIKALFPGKLFLFSETIPPEAQDTVRKPASQYSQLDYLLVHRLRGKGMPLSPAEWKSIVADAGLKLIDSKEVYNIALFLAEL
jgi:cyclopropane fatty-acyl-phospholipid synthase-like methyltransferase